MKFIQEDKKKDVFTTGFVVEGGAPVIFVHYDEDKDWQIFGSEILTRQLNECDMQLVSVEQILDIDPWLTTLPDLQPGQTVWRGSEEEGQPQFIVMATPDEIPDCYTSDEIP